MAQALVADAACDDLYLPSSITNELNSPGITSSISAPIAAATNAATVNSLPSQPTMMDLLARLSTNPPATPPSQSRTPVQAPASTSRAQTNGTIPESRSTPTVSRSQSNFGSSQASLDPSSSLKQLLGVMSPSGSAKTPNRSGTPPVRAPESPLAVRATIKKADSGYIPSAERNVDVASEGFDKEAARRAVLTGIENGQRAGTGPGELGSEEDDKQGQRDFVRGLLDCIHVSLAFWGQSCCRGCRSHERKDLMRDLLQFGRRTRGLLRRYIRII